MCFPEAEAGAGESVGGCEGTGVVGGVGETEKEEQEKERGGKNGIGREKGIEGRSLE